MFEIYSYAEVPYAAMSNMEVLQQLQNDHRLPRPARCPKDIYTVMCQLWSADPVTRMTAAQTEDKLRSLLASDLILEETLFSNDVMEEEEEVVEYVPVSTVLPQPTGPFSNPYSILDSSGRPHVRLQGIGDFAETTADEEELMASNPVYEFDSFEL